MASEQSLQRNFGSRFSKNACNPSRALSEVCNIAAVIFPMDSRRETG